MKFRLVLEGKAGEEIPESSGLQLEKVFIKQFCFIKERFTFNEIRTKASSIGKAKFQRGK